MRWHNIKNVLFHFLLFYRANSETMEDNVEVIQENGVLRINSATRDNQGQYICTASNAQGSTSATVTVTMQGLYIKTSCKVSTHKLSVYIKRSILTMS